MIPKFKFTTTTRIPSPIVLGLIYYKTRNTFYIGISWRGIGYVVYFKRKLPAPLRIVE